jgi:hypothetical protein
MIKLKYKGLSTEFVGNLLKEGVNNQLAQDIHNDWTRGEYKRTIAAGLSPVKGMGRFQGYSNSYKDQILGKIKFFTGKSGGVFVVKPEGKTKVGKDGIEYTPLRKGKVQREKFEAGLGEGKAVRPVNLNLTGELQKAITTLKVGANRVRVGIPPSASAFVKLKAFVHNNGDYQKNIPARRFIPIQGEELIVSLQRKLRDIFARHLSKIIAKRK